MLAEKRCRRLDEFFLLVPVDGTGGGFKATAGSIANFRKHQAIVILHDEINFTKPAAKVFCYGFESLVLQESMRLLLGQATALASLQPVEKL
jgi:hypothetical protein